MPKAKKLKLTSQLKANKFTKVKNKKIKKKKFQERRQTYIVEQKKQI